MTIVVARYQEDFSWLDEIKNADIFLIQKHFHNETVYKGADLPNIGRESHSYLWYIINHYDNLDDYTFFLQGNPYREIEAGRYQKLRVSEIVEDFYKNKSDFVCVGRPHFTVKDACPHHPGLRTSMFDHLIEVPSTWHFGAGAQFIVSRDRIHKHPKSVYEEMYQKHLTDHSTPWVIERLWPLIFSQQE